VPFFSFARNSKSRQPGLIFPILHPDTTSWSYCTVCSSGGGIEKAKRGKGLYHVKLGTLAVSPTKPEYCTNLRRGVGQSIRSNFYSVALYAVRVIDLFYSIELDVCRVQIKQPGAASLVGSRWPLGW